MTAQLMSRERLEELAAGQSGFNLRIATHEESKELARLALAALDSEPVAWLWSRDGDDERDVSLTPPEVDDDAADAIECGWTATPLYRHAQPAPVVPDDVLKALQKVARIRLDMDGFDGDRRGIADCLCDAEEALIEVVNRRAAMLQAAPVCTCPSGDGSLRWPCPAHPGNSPVVPDGYVMVPKEPTEEMISSGIAAHYDRSQIQIHDRPAPGPMECAYVAMLAAATQEDEK